MTVSAAAAAVLVCCEFGSTHCN